MKKKISIMCMLMLTMKWSYAQKFNWQNLDLKKDTVFGISTERAYKEILKNKIPRPVVVAVIDNGVDTSHEDLHSIIWTNSKEIPGNGKDDDHNGYIDDVHGWNFLGSESGPEDVTYLAFHGKDFYDSLSYTKVPDQYRSGYQSWKKMWNEYDAHVKNGETFLSKAEETKKLIQIITDKIGKLNPSMEDFEKYQASSPEERQLCEIIIHQLPQYKDFSRYKFHEIDELIDRIKYHIGHGLNAGGNSIKGGFYSNDRNYGNNDISGPCTLLLPSPGPNHGTHVAGIIGAIRNNQTGIQGIADRVFIMPVRVMSFYRELRDYDLANAIRYATDNGAKIINLSFGKPYSFNKKEVDDAVKYAMKNDVLIIHAAGNDAANIDNILSYPNPVYEDGSGQAEAWIEVGASRAYDDSVLVAAFSNYGKRKVDVFAPGTGIYSTLPCSHYDKGNGTSMAAPVVAGLAALIREYYPDLTAVQVREIIIKSVVKINHKVYTKNADGNLQAIPFADVCVSGGIVNAYNALKLAASYK